MDFSFRRKSPFERALAQGVASRNISSALFKLDDDAIEDPRDARALVRAIDRVAEWEPADRINALHDIALAMQDVRSDRAFEILRMQALPRLCRAFESLKASDVEDKRGLLEILRIAALYCHPTAVPLIVAAAKEGFLAESSFWMFSFDALGQAPQLARRVCRELASDLPPAFISVALLDLANGLWINHADDVRGMSHPFDSPAGWSRLEDYLREANSERFSYAVSAAAALPFISQPKRTQLLSLAMDHPATNIQIEAAWASAKIGSEAGLKMLARFCIDWRTADRAKRYLEEIGRADAIPPQAHDEDFCAMATMSQWLEHPNEYGRVPDELAIIDTRAMFWPPANERRRLWLFRYVYRKHNTDGSDDVGIGLVGGLTPFSLFNTIKPDWPIDDMYALHCSWESHLPKEGEPPMKHLRSDGPRWSVEHGRALLAQANAGAA